MNYFYAYHSRENTKNFNYQTGYGISTKSHGKLGKVATGDLVFVIQNVNKTIGYELCGLYKIESIRFEATNNYPYRVELSDFSKLNAFIPLDRSELNKRLPAAGKEGHSDRFMNHFTQSGRTFQNPLDERVVAILSSLITFNADANEDITTAHDSEFYDQVTQALGRSPKERLSRIERAPRHPRKTQTTVWRYERNPDVVAEVLIRAGNVCECCRRKAPFIRTKDGRYYLEVHHIIPLSQNGEDHVTNAIALCPNCHRREHFGYPRIDKNWQPNTK